MISNTNSPNWGELVLKVNEHNLNTADSSFLIFNVLFNQYISYFKIINLKEV